MNQAEIAEIRRQALARGIRLVERVEEADWAVVNTCTVTHVASRKTRQAIRRLRRQNPGVRVAAIGCYAELEPTTVEALPGVEIVRGTRDKATVVDAICDAHGLGDKGPSKRETLLCSDSASPTRAVVAIQDGCDGHCTYCVVTIARGPSRSVPIDRVLAQVRARRNEGHKEIVLTGINIGAYRFGSLRLADLVAAIIEETDVPRVRLSSIEPWDLDSALLDVLQNRRVCRHVHLPLQSGSDAVLQHMGRRYSTTDYGGIVASLRDRVPEIALTTDVIVGFPGETSTEWRETMAFVREMAFSRIHVFRYSRRHGTAAATMPCPVHADTAAERASELSSLARELARRYQENLVGSTVSVLFETEDARLGTWSGLTDTYVRVSVASDRILRNKLAEVTITSVSSDSVDGLLCDSQP